VETIDTYDDTYYNMIIQKLDMVKDYMKDSWGISLDDLRNEVLRRTENVYNLDLKTLK
jgi:UDP-galactopyranose mutase